MKKSLSALGALILGGLFGGCTATNPGGDTETFALPGHAESCLPAGKRWKLVWHDEFDGPELDRSKWGFRLNFWGRRFPAYSEQGVELKDGALRLHMIKLPDGNFTSAQLQTGSLTYDIPKDTPPQKFWPFGKMEKPRFLHRYGYYEIRCRLPKNKGWHAAFWLQAPGVGSHPDPRYCGVEVDVMETYLLDQGKIVGGPIWGGYGRDNRRSGHFQWEHVETPDFWHRYGVHWHPAGYDFYIDGKLVGRTTPDPSKVAPEKDEAGKLCGGTLLGPVSAVEQFILVTTECHGYRQGNAPEPELRAAKLPDYFEVDYVRVFDDVDLPPNAEALKFIDPSDKDGNFNVF